MSGSDLIFLAVLEFGSLSMLGWLAVGALPWLIHWWSRRRRHETSWAAVELLLSAVRQRARRASFQQWLLLAVRTAILALVAVAAARPVLREWAYGSIGGARTHHLLLLDQSYSMSCDQLEGANRSGDTRFMHAQTLARRIIESAAVGDLFTVIGWAQQAENLLGRATSEASDALSAVGETKIVHAPADLIAALRAAERATRQVAAELPGIARHRTVLITDMASNTWRTDKKNSAEIEKTCQQLAERGELLVCDVSGGNDDAVRSNAAVINLSAEPSLAMANVPVTILATLRTFGNRNWTPLELVLSVDGAAVDRQKVELPTSGEITAQFEHYFVGAGQHVVRVSLEHASRRVDCLPLDNRRWLVVEIREQTRVACIAGKSGAADDVARALAPHGPNRVGALMSARQSIQVDRFPASRLEEVDMPQYDALLLCNVAEFSKREAERLARYARRGGGVIFFLGDHVLPDRYNAVFASLLAMRVGDPHAEGADHFDPLGYCHPVVKAFRDRESAGLLTVEVAKYFPLELADASETKHGDPPIETVLSLDTGDPAIVVGEVGLGRVAVVAVPGSLASRTAAGSPWSSLAINPSFLPLVRELLAHVVGDREQNQFNRIAGEPLVYPANEAVANPSFIVQTPTGRRVRKTPTGEYGGHAFVFADTPISGIYTWFADNAPDESLAKFAVNLDTRESDLATIARSELPDAFAIEKVLHTPQAAGMGDVPLQRGLLVAALVLLLAELLLAWWMGRGWG